MHLFKKLNYIFSLAILILYSSMTMAHITCKIKEQSGTTEVLWCNNHHKKGMIRCYAKIKYSNGEEVQIWGNNCYNSYADCWASGKGGVEPRCSRVSI